MRKLVINQSSLLSQISLTLFQPLSRSPRETRYEGLGIWNLSLKILCSGIVISRLKLFGGYLYLQQSSSGKGSIPDQFGQCQQGLSLISQGNCPLQRYPVLCVFRQRGTVGGDGLLQPRRTALASPEGPKGIA